MPTEMTDAERDLRTTALNSNSTIKILNDIRAHLAASNPRHPPSGFRNAGEFLAAVRTQKVEHITDPRLMRNAATTWAGEAVQADGGFALPAEYRDEILMPVVGSGSLLSAFDPTPTPSDILRLATDETAEWATAGITANLIAEGTEITPSKAVLKQVSVPLHRVPALAHASGELIGRSPAYQRFVWKALARKLVNKTEAFIIQGTGLDQPLGLLNGPGRVTVSVAEGASTATTLSSVDIALMMSRLLPGSFPTAIWIIHSSVLPAMQGLAPGLWAPDAPTPYGYGRLAGRPIIVSEHCNPWDTTGDIILCDPAGYAYGLDGPYEDATIAFAFDQGLDSFRASIWMGGAPLISAPVARRTGSDTMSCCVVLAGGRS